jgi:regulatory protein
LPPSPSIKIITPEEALKRLQHLCSSREKCSSEIIEKMKAWNLPPSEQEKILSSLVRDKFVDDRRFAGFFARDKQKINKWGREKIRFAMTRKGLSREIIDEALESLPSGNSEQILRDLLGKKSRELSRFNPWEKKNRLIRFAVQRGFDYDLIFRLVDEYAGD